MTDSKRFVHPYIPNSPLAAEELLLKEIGESSAEDLFRIIPDDLKLHRRLDLPDLEGHGPAGHGEA